VVPHEKYFEIVHEKETYHEDSYVPIYNQILDIELIELDKVASLLKRHGGEIVYANTDNVIAEFKNKPQQSLDDFFFNDHRVTSGNWALGKVEPKKTPAMNIEEAKKEMESVFWDEKKTVAKYKEESTLKDKSGRIEVACTDEFIVDQSKYNIISDVQDNNFAPLVKQLLDMNASFQLDGRAGCGKTTLITQIAVEMKARNLTYICMAPTHKAKKLLPDGAQTINSFFSKFCPKSYRWIDNYDYIIVDEKSLIKEMFFRLLTSVKQNTKCKFIIAGDWAQLPPVQDRCTDFDYEHSSAIHSLCDGNLVQLSTCRRADDELFNLCKNVNAVDIKQFGKEELSRGVCYHNSMRKKMNQKWMEKKKPTKHMIIPKVASDKNSQEIIVYRNLPLIAHTTNQNYEVCNSDQFRVKHFNKNTIAIEDDEGKVKEIKHADFGELFYPAYYMTCHRAQGSTFKKPYTIIGWNTMSESLRYVALSRGTCKKNINIIP
jgi:DNA replication protein DnaC